MSTEEINYLREVLTCLDYTYKTPDKEIRKAAEKSLKKAKRTILSHLPLILETIKGNTLSKELSASLIIFVRNTIIQKKQDNSFSKADIIELIKTLVNSIISPDYPDLCLKEINKCFDEIINCTLLEEDSSIIFELMTLFKTKIKENSISILSYKGIAYIFENILCSSSINEENSEKIIEIELNCSCYMLDKLINELNSKEFTSNGQSLISYYLDTFKVIYGLLLNISVHSRKTFKNINKFLTALTSTFQAYAFKLLCINYQDKGDSIVKMNTKIFKYFISLIPTLPEYIDDMSLHDFHMNVIVFAVKSLESNKAKVITDKTSSANFSEAYVVQMLTYLTKMCFRVSFLGDFKKYLGEFTKKILFPLLSANETDKEDILNDEDGTAYATYIYDIATTRKAKGLQVNISKFLYQGSRKCDNYLKFVIEYATTLIVYDLYEPNTAIANDEMVVNASQEQRIETSLLVLCVVSSLVKNCSDLTSFLLNFIQSHFLFFIEKEKESSIIKERFCLFISIYIDQFLLSESINTSFYSNLCEFLLFNLFNSSKAIAKYESAQAIKLILNNNTFKDNFACLSSKYITQFIQYSKEAKSLVYFDILAEIFSSMTSEEYSLDLIKMLFYRVLAEISPRRLSHSGKNEIQMEKTLTAQYKEIISKCFYVIRTIFSKKQFIIKYYQQIEEMLSPLLVYMKYPNKIHFDDDMIIIMTIMIKTLKGLPSSALRLLMDLPQYLRKNKGLLLDLYELLNEYVVYSNNVIESSEDYSRMLFKLFKKSFTRESNYNKSPFLGCCLMQIWLMNSKAIMAQVVIDIFSFSLLQLAKLFQKNSTLTITEQNLVVALTTLLSCGFVNYPVLDCNNISFDVLIRYLECVIDSTIYSTYEVKLLNIALCCLMQNKDIIGSFPKILRHFLSFSLCLLKKVKQHEAKALKKRTNEEVLSINNSSDNDDESSNHNDKELDMCSSMEIDKCPIDEEDEYNEIGNRSINPYKSIDEFQLFKETLKRLEEGVTKQLYHNWFDDLLDSDKAALEDILNTTRITISANSSTNDSTAPQMIEIPRKIVKVKKH